MSPGVSGHPPERWLHPGVGGDQEPDVPSHSGRARLVLETYLHAHTPA